MPAITTRSSQPTTLFQSRTIAITKARNGAATPIMFPTFCAVEMRGGLSVASELNYLVIGTPVLPRKYRRIHGAQVGRHLLVADRRRLLLAGCRDFPVGGVARAVLRCDVGSRRPQRRQQDPPAARPRAAAALAA